MAKVYEIVLAERAKCEYQEFQRSRNTAFIKRIQRLLLQLAESPTSGIGQPEQLKYELAGCWSVRIDQEHRIVYKILENRVMVYVLSMKGHYPKG